MSSPKQCHARSNAASAFVLLLCSISVDAFATVRPAHVHLQQPTNAKRVRLPSPSLSAPFPLFTASSAASASDAFENATSTTPTPLSSSTNDNNINGQVDVDKKQPPFPVVLWRFTRPHTIIGSALAIPALHMLAAPSLPAAFSKPALAAMGYALLPALLMNLYITGLNQITDVEIDKVNKPNLPMAAGLLSQKRAIVIVVASLLASLGLGAARPTEGLNAALWLSGILGTVYSLKPFRFKRFPILAAFCIVSVRGFVINASFFAHSVAAAYGGLDVATASTGSVILDCLRNSRACFLSSLFFGVFGLVIALMKDVPDVVGDREANVRTFSVRLGQKQVYHAMRRLLSVSFVAVGAAFLRSAVTAASSSLCLARVATSTAAFVAGWSVRREAQGVDPENSEQVYDYYMHLWKLFYLSYFVLPFAR